MEKFAVSRLVGAPPGYVGYDEGGQLTEAVRRRPYAVVLFDEIEKAHPDVFNILLQILDDGHITDSQGRLVNFKNTILIMTSNLGSDLLTTEAEKTGAGREAVLALLRTKFRPEFLNREHIRGIVDIQLERFVARLEAQRISFTARDEAKDLLARKGFDPVYGARPLKRAIQRELETPLSRMIIAGEVKEGDAVEISATGEALAFKTGGRREK